MLERGAVEGEMFHRGAVQALAPEETEVRRRWPHWSGTSSSAPNVRNSPGEDGYRFRHLLIRAAAYDALPKSHSRRPAPPLRRVARRARRRWSSVTRSSATTSNRRPATGDGLGEAGRRARLTAGDRLAVAGGRAPSARRTASGGGGARACGRPGAAAATRRARSRSTSLRRLAPLTCARAAEIVEDARRARRGMEGDATGEALARAIGRLLPPDRRRPARRTSSRRYCRDRAAATRRGAAIACGARPPLGGASDCRSQTAAATGPTMARASEQAIAVRPTRRPARAPACSYLELAADPRTRARPTRPSRRLDQLLPRRPARLTPGTAAPGCSRCSTGSTKPCRSHASRTPASANSTVTAWANRDSPRSRSSPGIIRRRRRISKSCAPGSRSRDLLAELAPFALALGRELCALGRFDEAEQLARRGRELGEEQDAACQARWRQVQALVHAHRAEHGEAQRLAREAVAIMERTDGLNFQGAALCDLADVLRVAGHGHEAAAALAEATDRYDRKGNVPMARQVRARLDALEST